MKDVIGGSFHQILELVSRMARDASLQAVIEQASVSALAAVRNGNKLLFAGNGGSAADAQHMAAEYVSRFKFDRPGLAAIALTTDSSILTAIGNDYGYENVFFRQVEALGRDGDLLFLSSTSGRSPNVLRAISAARRIGVTTVLLTGEGYAPVADAPDIVIVVPSVVTARIQEMHLAIGHTICEIVEQGMFGS
jgi:D-sedoheptulose 7-phosphate isomerase